MHELTQTNSGMFGALIVTDAEHRFDPKIDKIILIGAGSVGTVEQRVGGTINGSLAPVLELEAGTTYRLRIVMIHPQANVVIHLGTDRRPHSGRRSQRMARTLPPSSRRRELRRCLWARGRPGIFSTLRTARANRGSMLEPVELGGGYPFSSSSGRGEAV